MADELLRELVDQWVALPGIAPTNAHFRHGGLVSKGGGWFKLFRPRSLPPCPDGHPGCTAEWDDKAGDYFWSVAYTFPAWQVLTFQGSKPADTDGGHGDFQPRPTPRHWLLTPSGALWREKSDGGWHDEIAPSELTIEQIPVDYSSYSSGLFYQDAESNHHHDMEAEQRLEARLGRLRDALQTSRAYVPA